MTRLRPWLVGLLGLILIVTAYAPTVQHLPFADHLSYLADTSGMTELTPILERSISYNRSRLYNVGDVKNFRPLFFLLHSLERWLWPQGYATWQAIGILLHLLVTWRLWCLLRLVRDDLLADLLALFFGTLAVAWHAVAWQHVQGYLLFDLFLLLALENYYRFEQEGGPERRLWAASGWSFLAACANETAMALPVLMGGLIVLAGRPRRVRAVAILLAAPALWFVLDGVDHAARAPMLRMIARVAANPFTAVGDPLEETHIMAVRLWHAYAMSEVRLFTYLPLLFTWVISWLQYGLYPWHFLSLYLTGKLFASVSVALLMGSPACNLPGMALFLLLLAAGALAVWRLNALLKPGAEATAARAVAAPDIRLLVLCLAWIGAYGSIYAVGRGGAWGMVVAVSNLCWTYPFWLLLTIALRSVLKLANVGWRASCGAHPVLALLLALTLLAVTTENALVLGAINARYAKRYVADRRYLAALSRFAAAEKPGAGFRYAGAPGSRADHVTFDMYLVRLDPDAKLRFQEARWPELFYGWRYDPDSGVRLEYDSAAGVIRRR